MSDFKLATSFEPAGDQPAAIDKLTRNLLAGNATMSS
jgi:excinuclease UvrABC helicase subunit UvrB